MSDTPMSVTPMSVDENPPCKRCGFATEYSGFDSAPPKLIYKCDLCGFHTQIDGKPKNGKPKTCVVTDQPHGQQRSRTKPEGQK
jgi:hypothetical protein